jgi:hypothetical protein
VLFVQEKLQVIIRVFIQKAEHNRERINPVRCRVCKSPLKEADMRLPLVFLISLLILTACTVPPQNVPPLKADPPTAPAIKEATFENSLLAVEWKSGSDGILLLPLDPASGAALPGYTPIPITQNYTHAFSPDRRTLAVVTFPNNNAYNGSLLLVDLPAWKTRTFELKASGWVSAMAFSPDGRRLAIADGESSHRLRIFDLELGVITTEAKMDSYVTKLKFTADGESLMLYHPAVQNSFTEVTAGPPQVLLFDAEDLSPRWTAHLEGIRDGIFPKDENTEIDLYQPGTAMYLSPALAFASDRDVLYVVQADSEQLAVVDFDAQKVKTVEIRDQLGWFEQLLALTADTVHAKIADGTSKQAVGSPDGRFLYIVGVNNDSTQDQQGNWQMSQTPLGLEIIDVGDGRRIMHVETDAIEMSLSPDGRFLYLRNWAEAEPWTEVFDTSSRQIIARKAGIYATPALCISGKSMLASTYSPNNEESYRMGIFQADSLKVMIEWTGPDYIGWLAPQ